MTSYLALLRGINVGGNNKVAMPALRECLEALGYQHVQTYINSGNVLFETAATNEQLLVAEIEAALEAAFGFHVIVCVLATAPLIAAMASAPDWWASDPASKHNVIFAIPPFTASAVAAEVGAALPEYEKVAVIEPLVFWSAPISTFSRTRWSKIVKQDVYRYVTIRNANTAKKLAALAAEYKE